MKRNLVVFLFLCVGLNWAVSKLPEATNIKHNTTNKRPVADLGETPALLGPNF